MRDSARDRILERAREEAEGTELLGDGTRMSRGALACGQSANQHVTAEMLVVYGGLTQSI